MTKPTKTRSGQIVPTLDKAQEKRFDEKFGTGISYLSQVKGGDTKDGYPADNDIKQHLAKELSIQKKEIMEKAKKNAAVKVDGLNEKKWIRLDNLEKLLK